MYAGFNRKQISEFEGKGLIPRDGGLLKIAETDILVENFYMLMKGEEVKVGLAVTEVDGKRFDPTDINQVMRVFKLYPETTIIELEVKDSVVQKVGHSLISEASKEITEFIDDKIEISNQYMMDWVSRGREIEKDSVTLGLYPSGLEMGDLVSVVRYYEIDSDWIIEPREIGEEAKISREFE